MNDNEERSALELLESDTMELAVLIYDIYQDKKHKEENNDISSII
jgi:hypothetical protein